MPSRWDAATHGWSRRVFHYPLPTLMSRKRWSPSTTRRLPRTIELQPLSLTPLKMRKVELRVEVALVAFNHQTEIRPEFSSINEFDPGFLKARRGARICEALNRAIDMIEARKDTY